MSSKHNAQKSGSMALAITALGVVFGDIGTSPLYALRETFHFSEVAPSEENVLGILSLVTWALIIVICIKYLLFILRANNNGEGGELALTALLGNPKQYGKIGMLLVGLGIFGTALIYGDGMITPAISVLAAAEGMGDQAETLENYTVPIAVAILVGLFSVQRKGTAKIGGIFGPVMVLWFSTLGLLGVLQILDSPEILRAVSPTYAVEFFLENQWTGYIALGSIFLVVTGGEALYADLGHFGRKPIGQSWFMFVMPGLLLNYFGQGAYIINNALTLQNIEDENPFFLLAPEWGRWPLVILATVATIIASQALISGAFSMTLQAVRLQYLPRLRIIHTSDQEQGQIYVPAVNWALMVASVGLVIGFQKASNLAAAYGIAVTISMIVSSTLFFVVSQKILGWSLPKAIAIMLPIFVVDVAFFGANVPKIPSGGWFPLIVGTALLILMLTWHRGRELIRERLRQGAVPLDKFIETLDTKDVQRTEGTYGVYLSGEAEIIPPALISDLRHHKVLPEHVYLLTIVVEGTPTVLEAARLRQEELRHGFHKMNLHYGYREKIDVAKAIGEHSTLNVDYLDYFIGREAIVVTDKPGMAKWREKLFVFTYRNTTSASRYFGLPIDKTTQSGQHIEL